MVNYAASRDDAPPFEANVFEVHEKCESKTSDIEVAQHLSNVRIGERSYYLATYDGRVVDDQIRDKRAYVLVIVKYWILSLRFSPVAALAKLYHERAFVELFI